MNLVHVSNDSFEKEVLQSTVPVLVDFYADWCNPCKMLAPIIEEIAVEKGDSIKVVKLNIEQAEEIAAEYKVMSIPTVILFKNGAIAHQMVGFKQKEALLKEFGL